MAQKPTVHRITNASEGMKQQQMDRSRKYMWSMSIRMVCFVAALLTDGPIRWVLLVGSLVLPWIAVVLANAGRENRLEKGEQAEIARPYTLE
jgi:hypothetical protein